MTSFSSPALPDPPPEAKPVTRWRWWFHLILIGGYVLPRIAFASQFPRHQPALSHSVGGLLAVSAIELALFALIFALACRVSRPSKEQLLLSWRPGWWVFPLGLGYSIVIRIAAGMALFFVILVLLGTHVLSADSAEHFIVARRPDIAKLVDVAALRADSAYFWLTLTLVSFVVAGVREEMWRAGTLAGLRAKTWRRWRPRSRPRSGRSVAARHRGWRGGRSADRASMAARWGRRPIGISATDHSSGPAQCERFKENDAR